MNKQIKNHKLYSDSDYQYLKGKGYTDSEIITIWNRDLGLGNTEGLVHKTEDFDIVKYLNS